MDSEIKLKALIHGVKSQIKAIRASLTEDQLVVYDAQISKFKKEFIEKNNITPECQEELDKYFF